MDNQILNLQYLNDRINFALREDIYIDADGFSSVMCWVPPFTAGRALTATGGAVTASLTAGDWFHPRLAAQAGALNTDYELIALGGFWIDKYLCSSNDASRTSMGTVATGGTNAHNYVSQPGVAPRVNQAIAHFKTYLAARFASGGFNGPPGSGWAGKGGLCPDYLWFQLWILSRINSVTLHGNTAGYVDESGTAATPHWDADVTEIGVRDQSDTAGHGTSITGGGPHAWDIPISDFNGNRWEFTDGLRLYNGEIYTCDTKANPTPPSSYTVPTLNDYVDAGLTVGSLTSGYSIIQYRTDAGLKLHGFPQVVQSAASGPMQGQGFWFSASGEVVALRGGTSDDGARSPGALYVGSAPGSAYWYIGARAALIP